MKILSALLLISAVQQPPNADPPWVGKWSGTYIRVSVPHPIELEIGRNLRILGSYDDGDWKKGKIHGNADKDGRFKFLFKYESNPSWGQIEGKFTLSTDGKTLTDTTAIFTNATRDPNNKRPETISVKLNRK